MYGKAHDFNEEKEQGNRLEIISNPTKDSYTQPRSLDNFDDAETVEEAISLQEKELEMIKQALDRNNGKRKLAAKELGISERTLYRKINQYNL